MAFHRTCYRIKAGQATCLGGARKNYLLAIIVNDQ